MVQCGIWVAAWAGVGYYLIKKLAVGTTQVTLTAETLTVQPTGGTARQVLLREIVSYAHNEYNGNESLLLRLPTGKPVVIGYNSTFCDEGDFPALVADFEAQIADVPPATTAAAPVSILREKTFFEKPVGNAIGWLILVAMVGFTGYLLLYGLKPGKTGSLFLVYGNGLAYLAAWRNARSKQAKAQ
ncbi:hypothetical protein D0N36_03485 [Hymenobacter lapidiphilus]|nr:hypothetical protein D0N36_03485 [Hymenobacter sp. CCM 8763]